MNSLDKATKCNQKHAHQSQKLDVPLLAIAIVQVQDEVQKAGTTNLTRADARIFMKVALIIFFEDNLGNYYLSRREKSMW